MTPIDRLQRLLRPAAGGIFTVSTGAKEQLRVQQRIYGAQSESDIQPRWRRTLERIAEARVVVLGVPSDAGAGFVRGASFAPQSLRRELLRRDSWLYRDPRVVDAGDVLVVPQLVHDEMLSAEQIQRSRRAIYGDAADAEAWPVSPLSIAQSALETIRALAPAAAPLVLGGDHSVGWPALAAVARGRERETGILHFDAHTDLLESRLGVRYCFATWAYHANELVGRGRRLAQVGIRISRKTREHWEKEHEVRQFWMDEVRARPVEDIADEIVSTMKTAGVRGVYVSNDIDGTDPLFGLATGTPEPGGLEPATVTTLIRRLGEAFPVWGSDLVEVAPTVAGHSPREPGLTLSTAADYVEVQARASLGES